MVVVHDGKAVQASGVHAHETQQERDLMFADEDCRPERFTSAEKKVSGLVPRAHAQFYLCYCMVL